MLTSRTVLADLIVDWHRTLAEWIRQGDLAEAIATGFELTAREADAVVAALQATAAPTLLTVEVLEDQQLNGLLGAYAAATRTAYLNETLAEEPNVVALVLTHELGHRIEAELPTTTASHTAIGGFVERLLPGAMARANTESALIRNQPQTSSISLPDGRKLAVEAFGTSLHKQFDNAALPFISAQAKAILTDAQDDTDSFNPLNKQSLQFYSFAHFDNNNISGGLAAVRRWYEDGLARFLTTDKIDERTKDDSALGLVNPEFRGPEAGVELLLYRFGQISHALQDFYSHSNWYQIVSSGYLPEDSILADGVVDLPAPRQPGDHLPGSAVMLAQAGPDWSMMLRRSGVGWYGLLKRNVYWEVDSDGKPSPQRPFALGSRFGLVGARKLNGEAVIGLSSGAVNGFAYADPDLSVLLRDPAKTGLLEREYFRGLDHGGIAGTVAGQWISPISKDSEIDLLRFPDITVKGYPEAVRFARLQLQNEWDRLGNLIFQRYGREGLVRFANMAISEEQRDAYVSTYDNNPGARWDWASQSTVRAFSLEPANQPNQQQAATDDADLADSTIAAQSLPDIRIARIFSTDPENPQQPGEEVAVVQFRSADGQWLDSAYEEFDFHHALQDEDQALLLTARPIQHVEAGGRATWWQSRPEDLSGNARIHFLENVNTDVPLAINDFDILQDRIVIVEQDGSEHMLPSRFSTYLGYPLLKALLLEQFNVRLDARPTRKAANNSWLIGSQDLAMADGSTEGLSLQAGEAFNDPDQSAMGAEFIEPNLSFLAYDESLPFLKLMDGQLVAQPNIQDYAGSTYRAMVWVSDGSSNLTEEILEIAVAPRISFADPAIGSFAADQLFEMDLLLDSEKAYSVLVEFSDQDSTTADIFELAGSQIGTASGVPVGFQSSDLAITLGTGLASGTPSFWLHPVNSDQWIELQIQPTGEHGFALLHNDALLASLRPAQQSSSTELRFDDYFVINEGNDVTGFTFTPDAESQLNFMLMGEAANSSLLGLYMTDLVTGALIDPHSGDLISSDESEIASTMDDISLFWQPVPSGTVSEFSIKIARNALIDYANVIWTPVIRTSGAEGSDTFFTTNGFNGDGQEHAILIGNQVIGFEDLAGGGDLDFDDVILKLLPPS